MHIYTLDLYPDLLKVTGGGKQPDTDNKKRGEIGGFTSASRKRLIQLLHSIEYESCTFVTLTYPATFPEDYQIYKQHLRVWRERLTRKHGNIKVVWRLEFQKRGAPHFHLLLFDAPYIDKEWLSRSWYEVVGSNDEKHLRAGTNVKLVVKSDQQALVSAYVSKYVAKTDDTGGFFEDGKHGRWWGKWNIDVSRPVRIEVTAGEAFLLVAWLGSADGYGLSYRPFDPGHCTLFGRSMGSADFARAVLARLEEIRCRARTGKHGHCP